MIRRYLNVVQDTVACTGDGLLGIIGHGWGDGQWYCERGSNDDADLVAYNEDMDFDPRWWV